MELKGGDKLMQKLEQIAKDMGGGSVRVGFLEGATYPDGTPVAAVAFWNEFGTATAPPRPFFRTTIENESPQWPAMMAGAAKHYDYDGDKVLMLMGEKIKEQIQGSINGWSTPPNAESTIQKKGFDKPLIDTANMRDSVDYEVNK